MKRRGEKLTPGRHETTKDTTTMAQQGAENEETRTRRFEEDRTGESGRKQDGNCIKNDTENRTTNEDEAQWISTIEKTTDEEKEGDGECETTHKVRNPEERRLPPT